MDIDRASKEDGKYRETYVAVRNVSSLMGLPTDAAERLAREAVREALVAERRPRMSSGGPLQLKMADGSIVAPLCGSITMENDNLDVTSMGDPKPVHISGMRRVVARGVVIDRATQTRWDFWNDAKQISPNGGTTFYKVRGVAAMQVQAEVDRDVKTATIEWAI